MAHLYSNHGRPFFSNDDTITSEEDFEGNTIFHINENTEIHGDLQIHGHLYHNNQEIFTINNLKNYRLEAIYDLLNQVFDDKESLMDFLQQSQVWLDRDMEK